MGADGGYAVPSAAPASPRALCPPPRPGGRLPPLQTRLMTALIVLLRIASHYDGGLLAALYGDKEQRFETELGLSSTELGLIVTLGYVGLICGCVVAGGIMSRVPSKQLVQASGFLLMAGTALFAGAANAWMMYGGRVVIGFGQSLQTVLYPVWADEFAPPGSASGYLAALQAGGPLGIVAGYIVSGSIMANTDLSWRWCFIVQLIVMCVPLFIFFFVPPAYIDVRHRRRDAAGATTADGTGNTHNNDPLSVTVVVVTPKGTPATAARPQLAARVLPLDAEGGKGVKRPSPLRMILSNGVVWCASLVLSSLYFVVNGMQTWVTDYIVSPNSTVDASENTVIATFGVTAATAPVSGIVLGGLLLAKLGGYRRYPSRACYTGLVEGALATAAAYTSLVVHDFGAFMTCLWLTLFFGGAMVPGMVGIIVTAVPKRHRSLVTAFASVVYNLLGYALGPLAAGVAADRFENEDVGIVWGFRIVMGWSAVALLLQAAMVVLWRLRRVPEPRAEPPEDYDFGDDGTDDDPTVPMPDGDAAAVDMAAVPPSPGGACSLDSGARASAIEDDVLTDETVVTATS